MAAKSDIELVEAAVRGQTECFGELCERYYPAMVAVAHSILGDRHLAEDVAQETFAKACYKLSRLKDKNKFAGWLAVICRNVARDMAKARGRIDSIKDLSVVSLGTQESRGKDLSEVREAINKLPDLDREVIFLRYYNNLPYEEISQILGISKAAINGKLTRAKKKIAQYLEQNYLKGD